MNKQALKSNLFESHNSFIAYLESLTEQELLSINNDKWTAGQQLEHIYLSVKLVRQVLTMPTFLINLAWGKTKREGKSYDGLVEKYQLKLANGGRATGRFIPKAVSIEKCKQLKIDLKIEVEKLAKNIEKFEENELDTYVLPHPLLGKLTIREMLYFTIYHVGHHEELTKRDLKK